jgi:hypothetical protein
LEAGVELAGARSWRGENTPPKEGIMGKLIVVNSLSPGGVMQAPGRIDEDTRDGFTHGGWARPYSDEVMGRTMGQRVAGDTGATAATRSTPTTPATAPWPRLLTWAHSEYLFSRPATNPARPTRRIPGW